MITDKKTAMIHSTITDQNFSSLFKQVVETGIESSIILTPNKRLSRYLVEQYSQYQVNQSADARGAWHSLQCHSIRGWIEQQWTSLCTLCLHPQSDKVPLSSFQESLLWERAIEQHPDTPPLLALTATVKLAQSAWRLMHEWHLDLNELQDPNTQLFLKWCYEFQKRCEEKQLISTAEQTNAIIESVSDQLIQGPASIYLYGFDELSPQLEHLLKALADTGSQIFQFELEQAIAKTSRYEFSDLESEMLAAARWAKHQVETLLAEQDVANRRIAIVVPDLAQNRTLIERVFDQVFSPQSQLPQSQQHAPGYNLSAAIPLQQIPVVNIALKILGCHSEFIDIEVLSQLLRSPFVGIMPELDHRALIDLQLRDHDFDISLKQFKHIAGGFKQADQCPDFYQRLSEFEKRVQQLKSFSAVPSQWIAPFIELLSTMGWPGNRPLDTLEFQQLQIWQETLDQYAALDYVVGKISIQEATKLIRQLITQASFKAQTKDSPIQILGVLEAAGLPFESIWIMNLDDETWPPAPNPNPLIPISLQIERQLPQSSATRELLYAKRLTQRFTHSANHILFSHATAKDGQPLLVSPLTAAITKTDSDTLSTANEQQLTYAEQLFGQPNIETSWDDCGPHVSDPTELRGGSQLLKDQAACPFRAFARHRLHSEGLPSITIGLDASERGNLLHTALEIIWKKLRNQQTLLEMDEHDLNELIAFAINEAMQDIKSKRFVGERFINIETERLTLQIQQWLSLEKNRAPFQVVLNEGKRTVKLSQLPIRIRYDRVDKLEDGSLFVLDYKTGKPMINSWGTDRPDEPQVPLYCIANQEKVSGAAFGQVNVDEVAIKGVAADDSVAPGLSSIEKITITNNTDNWDNAVAQWRQVLEKLANEFLAGAAQVAPKKPNETCRYCDLAALCRIKDQTDFSPSSEEKSFSEENLGSEAGGSAS